MAVIMNISFFGGGVTKSFILLEMYGLSSRQCCQHLQGAFPISRRRQQVSSICT